MTAQQTDFEARAAPIRQKYLKPKAQRPPSTARGVHHVALICSDVERTIQFYDGVLGFPLFEIIENRDYKGSTHLFFDGTRTCWRSSTSPAWGSARALSRSAACSTSPSRSSRSSSSRQGAPGGGRMPYVGPDRGIDSIYFKDPDGIQIELIREPRLVMDGRPLGE